MTPCLLLLAYRQPIPSLNPGRLGAAHDATASPLLQLRGRRRRHRNPLGRRRPGSSVRPLGHGDHQHSLVHGGGDAVRVGVLRQAEGAAEAVGGALATEQAAAQVLGLVVQLAGATDLCGCVRGKGGWQGRALEATLEDDCVCGTRDSGRAEAWQVLLSSSRITGSPTWSPDPRRIESYRCGSYASCGLWLLVKAWPGGLKSHPWGVPGVGG